MKLKAKSRQTPIGPMMTKKPKVKINFKIPLSIPLIVALNESVKNFLQLKAFVNKQSMGTIFQINKNKNKNKNKNIWMVIVMDAMVLDKINFHIQGPDNLQDYLSERMKRFGI